MSTATRVGACIAALTISAACTGHADAPPHEQTEVEAKPEPEPPEQQLPDPSTPAPSELTVGPITPLVHKPITGVLGELTGDTQPDVLALCHLDGAAGLQLLRGAADGSFSEAQPEPVAGSGLALGDFDGDFDLDALILDASGAPAYRVALNDGHGAFTIGDKHSIRGRYGGELDTAALADIDGDGRLDAVVPTWDSLAILHGDGDGGFRVATSLRLGRDPFDVEIGDLDGDGHLDVVATTGSGLVRDKHSYDPSGASAWIFRGEARGFADPIAVGIADAKQIEIADLDGDGRSELVVSHTGGLTVIHDPLGTLTTERIAVANDGRLLVADILAPAGADLIVPSWTQSRLHVLTGYPSPNKRSFDAGNFVVDLFVTRVADEPGMRLVLLDAGPPGDPYGPPAPAIETLFVSGPGRTCARCERDSQVGGR